MKGRITNFRGSRRIKKGNQMIVEVEGADDKAKAEKLIGKSVSWVAPGKNKTTINGKISALHGNSGCVRVLFERGLPGQSVGTEVKIE